MLKIIVTANRATRSDPAFAASVAELQPILAAWRKERKPRDPIPEPLWHSVVRMARAYRTGPVAHALRVNYTALKRRVQASSLAPDGANQLSSSGS